MTNDNPPTEAELTEWRAALNQPGPPPGMLVYDLVRLIDAAQAAAELRRQIAAWEPVVRAAEHIAAANPAAVLSLGDLAVRAMRMAVALGERSAALEALNAGDCPATEEWATRIRRAVAATAALPGDWRETLAQFRAELAALDKGEGR